jgi:hypothetical protein
MNAKISILLTVLLTGALQAQVAVAQATAMYVSPEGNVGVGTAEPLSPMHIYRDDDTAEFFFLESNKADTTQDRAMMYLVNNGGIRFEFNNPVLGAAWRFQAATGNRENFEITKVGTGQLEMILDSAGNLTITGNYSQNSDRNVKRDIESIDGQEVLARLDQLSLSEWSYIADPEGVRHVGPMAQDFYAAFGLGPDETKIAPGDMAGVSLAAVKMLSARNAELEKRITELEQYVRQLVDVPAQEL